MYINTHIVISRKVGTIMNVILHTGDAKSLSTLIHKAHLKHIEQKIASLSCSQAQKEKLVQAVADTIKGTYNQR